MIEIRTLDYLLAGFIGGLMVVAVYTLTKVEEIIRKINKEKIKCQ